tara:strand:+ start:262 stop:420 length:159 start_codon:yes stop_codon:yes gene_type:complete
VVFDCEILKKIATIANKINMHQQKSIFNKYLSIKKIFKRDKITKIDIFMTLS